MTYYQNYYSKIRIYSKGAGNTLTVFIDNDRNEQEIINLGPKSICSVVRRVNEKVFEKIKEFHHQRGTGAFPQEESDHNNS